MAIKQHAVEGVMSGFVIGSVDAYSEKLLYAFLLVGAGLTLITMMIASGSGGGQQVTAFEGMSLLEIAVYFVAFTVGWSSAHLIYSEAFGDD
jgi:hypothetical protein